MPIEAGEIARHQIMDVVDDCAVERGRRPDLGRPGDGLAFDDSRHDLASADGDDLGRPGLDGLGLVGNSLHAHDPLHWPVQAASMHWDVVPNQASTPRMAGK